VNNNNSRAPASQVLYLKWHTATQAY